MLSAEERQLFVDQALALIEHLYVHLPLKRAMHAVDPLQRLKLLKHRSASLSEPAFHAEMISFFTRLRDLHTIYILPQPLQSLIAYLPFRMDEYFEGDEQRYLVTQVKPGAEEGTFKPGVLVTHWNGVPIHRAVEINADREAGSNLDARHARGLASMTIRPLAMSLPPDEDWVVVTYQAANGSTEERRFKWLVFDRMQGGGDDPLADDDGLGLVLGLDAKHDGHLQRRLPGPRNRQDPRHQRQDRRRRRQRLGPFADAVHRTTRRDLLEGGIDLLHRAGEMLAAMEVQAITAKVQSSSAPVKVDVTTENVNRLDLFLNARPCCSLDVADGTTAIELPPPAVGPSFLELRGFRKDQLVASTRIRL